MPVPSPALEGYILDLVVFSTFSKNDQKKVNQKCSPRGLVLKNPQIPYGLSLFSEKLIKKC